MLRAPHAKRPSVEREASECTWCAALLLRHSRPMLASASTLLGTLAEGGAPAGALVRGAAQSLDEALASAFGDRAEASDVLSSALAAARAPVTIRLAAGVYREGTLHLLQGVTLIGAGSDTVLESESTVLICDGAVARR